MAKYTDEQLAPYMEKLSEADRGLSADAQRSIAEAKYDWANATTDADRNAANRRAEDTRWSAGGYLAGKSGTDHITKDNVYTSSYDKYYMTPDQLNDLQTFKAQEKAGYINTGDANKMAEQMRKQYGYSGGEYGDKYIPLTNKDGSEQFTYEGLPDSITNYQNMIQNLSNNILNQAAFSYDPSTDPLYQIYAQQYTRNGQAAMQNTLAQISARTGGLASSYAGTAAQQAYQGYMDQLSGKIPELYQLAYNMYRDRISDQRANIEMLQGLSDSDYNRYANERNFAYNNYLGNRDYNYQVGRDANADYQFEVDSNRQAAELLYGLAQNAAGLYVDGAELGIDTGALTNQYLEAYRNYLQQNGYRVY